MLARFTTPLMEECMRQEVKMVLLRWVEFKNNLLCVLNNHHICNLGYRFGMALATDV